MLSRTPWDRFPSWGRWAGVVQQGQPMSATWGALSPDVGPSAIPGPSYPTMSIAHIHTSHTHTTHAHRTRTL